MNQAFLEYYRCPDTSANFALAGQRFNGQLPGYFTFGSGLTFYGRSVLPRPETCCETTAGDLPDAAEHVRMDGHTCVLPFDPTEIATNLRYELYASRTQPPAWKRFSRKIYYAFRPFLPTYLRCHLQRASFKGWDQKPFPQWPVDRSVDRMFGKLMVLALKVAPDRKIPFIWFWPGDHSSCAIMTHDVETAAGLAFIPRLMAINASFQIPASFQLIPDARYTVTPEALSAINAEGFEVNVHDLKHDGHLFDDHTSFQQAAPRINNFARRFGARGFRSAILYRNQAWFDSLRFSYDMSVPNVAHLDPQAGGCCTVMPYFIGKILELPVTATQDYTLFHILKTYSQDLWRQQIALVFQQHGMLNFIVHPDYLNTPRARDCYTTLLAELSRLRVEAGLWIALPREVDTWWRQRNAMALVPHGNGWRIKGEGSERARIAYATLHNDELTYVFS
jgi:hypothetical protein